MAAIAITVCKIVRSRAMEMKLSSVCPSRDEGDVWLSDSEGFASSIAVSIFCLSVKFD